MSVLRSKYWGTEMNNLRDSELVFEVTEEADGGYVAECLTESSVTQGDTGKSYVQWSRMPWMLIFLTARNHSGFDYTWSTMKSSQ
jgi:hypothetical protein